MFSINTSEKSISQTELLYLSSNALNCIGRVMTIHTLNDDSLEIVTDKTPFYVKGGGQKSDIGIIKSINGDFAVNEVHIDGCSILHIGQMLEGSIKVNDTVELVVDSTIRKLHTQLHTAGELICAAIRYLGYDWDVVGAIHYPERCSIDFNVILSRAESDSLKLTLQNQLNEMIRIGSEVKIQNLTAYNDVIEACGYYPSYISFNEPIRVVTVWNGVVGRPCMGTHLDNANQLQPIEINEIKTKKGNTIIKYNLHR